MKIAFLTMHKICNKNTCSHPWSQMQHFYALAANKHYEIWILQELFAPYSASLSIFPFLFILFYFWSCNMLSPICTWNPFLWLDYKAIIFLSKSIMKHVLIQERSSKGKKRDLHKKQDLLACKNGRGEIEILPCRVTSLEGFERAVELHIASW